MTPPRVTAVVVTFRNPEMLKALLSDLAAQTLPLEKIIVVDNGGGEAASDFPRVDYVRMAENTGSSGGYHEGFKRAAGSADFILTLDDDVALPPDAVEKLVAGFFRLEGSVKLGAVRAVGPEHPATEPTELEVAPWRGTLFKASVVAQAGPPESS
jgi:glycosyltransferase involved in cell wall biosynthesis